MRRDAEKIRDAEFLEDIRYLCIGTFMYVVCYNVCCNVINLTLSMHAPEGYGSHCVCVCVVGMCNML